MGRAVARTDVWGGDKSGMCVKAGKESQRSWDQDYI